ncbi:8666_t:CDS:2, partial [Gigaspora rosea]
MSKTDKVKYTSVIHYIRLIQHNSSKTKASQFVATIHNGDVYLARCISAWGKDAWKYQKGIYMDGHKREDIVAYHKVFLQDMKKYERLMLKWNGINCDVCEEPNLLPETIGRLKDEEGEARSIMQLGVNNDGYWDGKKLLFQVKNALLIFERTQLEC